MPDRGRIVAASVVLLGASFAFAAPTLKPEHVCAPDEGKGVCPLGKARMCAIDGALAACSCPPGMSASAPSASCVLEPSGKPPVVACTVPDATIGKALGASLEFGELEVPTLPTLAFAGATDTVAALDPKLTTLDEDEHVKLSAALQSIEGAAAYEASSAPKPKLAGALTRRDAALARHIVVRKAFLARFPGDPRVGLERVSLARALLRRAAYAGVATGVAVDRAEARALLGAVVSSSPAGSPSVAARTASFILGEQAVRDKAWSTVITASSDAIKWAAGKVDPDDHAYVAAAYARIAQARLELGDLVNAKLALAEAIGAGNTCAPRAECVSAAAGARGVLDRAWGATSAPARTMAPLLTKGAMPKQERVRPLVRLAELYAKAPGPGCASAAEEARAYAQVIK